MSKPRAGWRRTLLFVGIFLILVGAGIGALPIWFPWVARPVARAIGFQFAHYRPLGLTRFEITGVTGKLKNVEITADHVEAFLPHAWLWALWIARDRKAEYVKVRNWGLTMLPRDTTKISTEPESSTLRTLDNVNQLARTLQKWLPVAQMDQGMVRLRAFAVTVPETSWSQGNLNLRVLPQGFTNVAFLDLDVARPGQWRLKLEGGLPNLSLESRLQRTAHEWNLAGTVEWRSNQAAFTARFDEKGWPPVEGQLSATNLVVPGDELGAPHYRPLRGAIAIHWLNGQFNVDAHGQAKPDATLANTIWPPLELQLKSHGDLQSATIDALQAGSPWFNVTLNEPIRVNLAPKIAAQSGSIDIRANLAGLKPDWQGIAWAGLRVVPGTNGYPSVAIHTSGTNFSMEGVDLAKFNANATFAWPLLEIEQAQAVFGSNTVAHLHGGIDLQQRELKTTVLDLEGGDLAQFLPNTIGVVGLQARVAASGPIIRPHHQGELRVTQLTIPQLNPLKLSFRWEGEGTNSASVAADVAAGNSRLTLAGQFAHTTNSTTALEAQLDKLTLEHEGRALYQLQEPAHLRWQTKAGWQFQVDSLAWSNGSDRSLTLSADTDWPKQGRLRLKANQVALADARDFWPKADREATLSDLELSAAWTNGPVDWHLDGKVRLGASNREPYLIDARMRGDRSGATIDELTVAGSNAPTLVGHGRLPVALHPSSDPLIQLLPDAPMDFAVSNQVTDSVVIALGPQERLELSHPGFVFRVTGTPSKPQGELSASLASAQWRSNQTELALPRFENLKLAAVLQPESVQLRQFEFQLEDQPVSVQGSWPLPNDAWEKLILNGKVPDWHQASGRLLVEKAELAPLAQHLPTLLTSQGELHLDIHVRPGPKLDGFLTLSNAMTRPLGPLAPLREIEARIAFSGSTAQVDRFTGRLGGSPVSAGGHATISDAGELAYALQFHGTNAPLVRQPGLLLRANLDLNLDRTPGQDPIISGSVKLREGLLLQDVSSMLVDRLERPSLHPPYFSVTNLPFARWKLDLKVTGDRFLRVRSPAFAGSISTDAAVQGSLGKPVIKADVRIPNGRILFPFGKLDVERAYATLAGEDPRGPVIDLVAAGQNYNYNIRLEVTGTLENLNVLFTSTPPLSSEEILLMLTAGELPNKEITYSAEARAGRLITYLGREVVTRFFGDEFGEERLTINSGENIARSGRTTYSIEYRLTPRWSLVGEYDQFNALNAGLKWRIYMR